MTAFKWQPNITCYGSRFNGLITLHGNGNGTGTGNRTGTIGNYESRFLFLSGTNVNISV